MISGGVSSPSSPCGLCRARFALRSCVAAPRVARRAKRGGARRDRTADLVIANDALSQLSYGPIATALTLTTADNRRHLQSAPRSSQERRNRCFPRHLPGTSLVWEGGNRYQARSRIRDPPCE